MKHYKLVTHKVASRGSPEHRLSDSVEPRASEGRGPHYCESHGGEDDSLQGQSANRVQQYRRGGQQKNPEARPVPTAADLDTISSRRGIPVAPGSKAGHNPEHFQDQQKVPSQTGSLAQRRAGNTESSRAAQNY